MKRTMFDYTKTLLERVSFDPTLFCKELDKALQMLLPYEIEKLGEWLSHFINEKPELRPSLLLIRD